MLKLLFGRFRVAAPYAAASARLCVETANGRFPILGLHWQPPLRGCVLKPIYPIQKRTLVLAAASARLCVETARLRASLYALLQPPLRGCVLKLNLYSVLPSRRAQPPLCGCVLKLLPIVKLAKLKKQPPPCGCVLKQKLQLKPLAGLVGSRLRAAVC